MTSSSIVHDSSIRESNIDSVLIVFQLLHFYIERYGAQYLGTSDELPKPTESAIISGLERVILTSAPYQTFLMKLRGVSLWQQPKHSACYMAVYFVLWWCDCLVASVVSLCPSSPTASPCQTCHERLQTVRTTVPQLLG